MTPIADAAPEAPGGMISRRGGYRTLGLRPEAQVSTLTTTAYEGGYKKRSKKRFFTWRVDEALGLLQTTATDDGGGTEFVA